MSLEVVRYRRWRHNIRLANREVELIVTRDVGPRVIRFGFIGERNVFCEIPGQMGGSGETEWMIRGGHRLWIAPEEKPRTYELDNSPIEVEEIPDGIVTKQPAGSLSHVARKMEITLARDRNRVKVTHVLTNEGVDTVHAAPWALSVMAARGMAVIPLPAKIPHTDRLTHNQEWSLWGYTDFSDRRWTLGSRYVFFRQDRKRGPNKLGIAHREGWIAYLVAGCLFVKRFTRIEGASYPDGGVNFETFSNEDFLELESLGPMTALAPGQSVSHEETWDLHKNAPRCKTEADVDAHVLPRIR